MFAGIEVEPQKLEVSGSPDKLKDLEEIKAIPSAETIYTPDMADTTRQDLVNGWQKAVKAAKAGKHIIVEKPMAITRSKIDKVVEAARAVVNK